MPLLRLLLVVPIALALVGAWYAGRWYLGNTIAEFTPRVEERAMDSAHTALKLAPDDPLSHWSAGQVEMKGFAPGQLAEAVKHFEEAVSLSPNDYRLWMDLGRAREQSGDSTGGEKALRRAVELAPSYAYPRWFLGNLLLRQGRVEEAFAELRRASETDERLRPQVFNQAWYTYGEDVRALERAVGDSARARAALVAYLIDRERIDEALKVWAGLNLLEKKEQRETGNALVKALVAAKRYRAVLDVARDLAPPGANLPVVGQVFNGSFESDAGAVVANIFGWQINPSSEVQIAIDPHTGHQSSRSLRVVFNAPTRLLFNNISQLIVVEPATRYRFECYALTRNLKTAGAPTIEIIDGTKGDTLGTSQPLSIDNHEWQHVTIDFQTPDGAQAVTLRTSRASCGPKMSVCPILGMAWYDDFNLQRIGASADTGGSADAGRSDASAKGGSAR